MEPQEFNQQLKALCAAAINGGKMDITQIIGQLEIAKLNVDQLMRTSADQKQAGKIAKAFILPANGRPPGNG